MFGRFLPREVKFFELFNDHAQQTTLGAEALVALMTALSQSPDAATDYAGKIDEIEAAADKITHETVAKLHSTFITPLDRDEIHQLIKNLDNVLDTIQDAAGTVVTYDLRRATPECVRFADIILRACKRMADAVALLSDMSNGPAILAACAEVNKLESEADLVLRESMSRLFREEADVRELIKQKAIYELLETVTDHCKKVANTLESIVLENS